MAIFCKYHVEECEKQSEKYYCKRCGRILNDNEIMNISLSKNQETSEPESTADAPKKKKNTPANIFKGQKNIRFSILSISSIIAVLSIAVIHPFAPALAGWIFAFALVGMIVGGFEKVVGIAAKSDYFTEKMPEANERSLYYQLDVGHWYGVYDDIWVSKAPDSAGGWDINIQLQNVCKMPINYVYFSVHPIDPFGKKLGDPVQLTFTGPLAPREKKIAHFNHIWYDKPIGGLVINEVRVVLKNGTSQILNY